MAHLIDKDALVAEVVKKVFELLIDEDKVKLLLSKISNDAPKIYEGFMYNLSDLYKFVTDEYKDKIVNVVSDNIISDNLIEVKEEDLDNVIENYIHENFGERWDGCVPVGCFELDSMAEHFYMLGFNARKEE